MSVSGKINSICTFFLPSLHLSLPPFLPSSIPPSFPSFLSSFSLLNFFLSFLNSSFLRKVLKPSGTQTWNNHNPWFSLFHAQYTFILLLSQLISYTLQCNKPHHQLSAKTKATHDSEPHVTHPSVLFCFLTLHDGAISWSL